METPSVAEAQAPSEGGLGPEVFAALEATWQEHGAAAVFEQVIDRLDRARQPRALLDALLMKARHELALPLVYSGTLSALPEPQRTQYEERYVAALRRVGKLLLDQGDLIASWPYYRAISEPGEVAEALETIRPETGDPTIGALIDVALHGGAHPRRGFELVLEHYGTCSAISAFESLPPDEGVRAACAALLLRTLHAHLTENLRAELARLGHVKLAPDLPIPALISGREDLFADEAYHIDVSHLASVVRMSPLLTDRADLTKALELCEYGRRLSPRLRYDDAPPFEQTYEDHAGYLKALLGREVEAAIARFRSKLAPSDPEGGHDTQPAQVLIRLLLRLNRLNEAIEVAAEHLAGVPDSLLACPGLATLCARAGQFDRIEREARARGDLVEFVAALLQRLSS
jgi:hypothetical protein